MQVEEKNSTDKIQKEYEMKLANAKDIVIKNQLQKIAKMFNIELVNIKEDISNSNSRSENLNVNFGDNNESN